MPSIGLTNLDDSGFNRLQEILERFEKDSHRSTSSDWSKYVPPVGDELRGPVLEELIRTDLELRWRRRKRTFLEVYLKHYPELVEQRCVPSLLAEEFNIRKRLGDKPQFSEYQARFPSFFDEFFQLVDVEADADPSPVGDSDAPIRRSPITPSTPIPLADSLGGNVGDTGFPFAGKFKKIRRIGSGATGEVWEARGPGGVPVAIKRVFGAVALRAIQRERESLDLICSGRLRHPFLLQIFGWWVQEDLLHIAMELADDSLDNRLIVAQQKGREGLEPQELIQFMVDAGDALDFLNRDRNILHRDIKPANMLIMANRLKLGDFGLSRMTENLAVHMGRTMGAGTPVFIAPEVIAGFQNIQSDQYSLAASYFFLRAGRPLFVGKVTEIREQHLNTKPDFDNTPMTPGEQRVLTRALAKRPENRYANCAEFVQDLRRAIGHDNPSLQPGPALGGYDRIGAEPTDPSALIDDSRTAEMGGSRAELRDDETFVERTQPLTESPTQSLMTEMSAATKETKNKPKPFITTKTELLVSQPKINFDEPIAKVLQTRSDDKSTVQSWLPLNRSSLGTDLFATSRPEPEEPPRSMIRFYIFLTLVGIGLGTSAIILVQWLLKK